MEAGGGGLERPPAVLSISVTHTTMREGPRTKLTMDIRVRWMLLLLWSLFIKGQWGFISKYNLHIYYPLEVSSMKY